MPKETSAMEYGPQQLPCVRRAIIDVEGFVTIHYLVWASSVRENLEIVAKIDEIQRTREDIPHDKVKVWVMNHTESVLRAPVFTVANRPLQDGVKAGDYFDCESERPSTAPRDGLEDVTSEFVLRPVGNGDPADGPELTEFTLEDVKRRLAEALRLLDIAYSILPPRGLLSASCIREARGVLSDEVMETCYELDPDLWEELVGSPLSEVSPNLRPFKDLPREEQVEEIASTE